MEIVFCGSKPEQRRKMPGECSGLRVMQRIFLGLKFTILGGFG